MSEKDDDPIGKNLGLPPMNITQTVNQLLAKGHDDSAKTDFETARNNLLQIIEDGNASLAKLVEIAAASQHPRAFEVIAKLIDTLASANKDLLELQSRIRDLDAVDAPHSEKAQTINNNLFVGSTAELQKMISEMKNGKSG